MPTNPTAPTTTTTCRVVNVLPALIRKAHEAGQRGDAELCRLGHRHPAARVPHVDDLADACVHLMETGADDILTNVGVGSDVTIRQLAETVCEVVGFPASWCLTPPSLTARPASSWT